MYKKTIDILYAHTYILNSDFKTKNKRFSSLFTKFVQALEKREYIKNYLNKSNFEMVGI